MGKLETFWMAILVLLMLPFTPACDAIRALPKVDRRQGIH
jgi:hypothetical protein